MRGDSSFSSSAYSSSLWGEGEEGCAAAAGFVGGDARVGWGVVCLGGLKGRRVPSCDVVVSWFVVGMVRGMEDRRTS